MQTGKRIKDSGGIKRTGIFFLALFLLMIMTGCGENKEAQKNYEDGLTAISEEKYEKARESLLLAIQKEETKDADKQNKKNYYALGVALSHLNEPEEALSYFQKALKLEVLEEWDSDIYAYSADAYIAGGNYQKALKAIRKARKDNEKDMDLILKEYYLLTETGKEKEAEALLNEGLGYKGLGDEFAYKQARLYYYIGNIKKAQSEMEKAAKKGFAGAYVYLGMISEDLEDDDTALSMYEKCRKMLKKEGNVPGFVYCKLIDAYIRNDKYDRAEKRLKEAGETGDGTCLAELKKDEIAVLEHRADFEGAYQAGKEYQEQYPEDQEVEREMEFLETRVKQPAKKKK